MNINANITLDIPTGWHEFQDAAYYKEQHGQMVGDPRENMEQLLKKASTQFESCLDHGIKFMLNMDRLEPFKHDGLIHVLRGYKSSLISITTPPTTETKIMTLREALNDQRRPYEYHHIFNGVLDYCLAVEKLRQQAGYKLNCPGQRIWLREMSEVAALTELAFRKLDSAFDRFHRPFYPRLLKNIPTPEEEQRKRLMKVTRQQNRLERREANRRKPAQHSEKRAK